MKPGKAQESYVKDLLAQLRGTKLRGEIKIIDIAFDENLRECYVTFGDGQVATISGKSFVDLKNLTKPNEK